MVTIAIILIARHANGCGLLLNPDISLPSEATSCNSRSDARQGRARSSPGAWQVSCLINGTTQVRAPLRGSARRAPESIPQGLGPADQRCDPLSVASFASEQERFCARAAFRAQGAVPTGTVPLALPCSGRKIATACEVKFMRPDTTARDQADRSDNTASRASRFEVSAEQHRRNRLFLAESHNSLLTNQLHPFSRNR